VQRYKVYSKQFPHVLKYSQQCFVMTLLPHIVLTLLMAHGYVGYG